MEEKKEIRKEVLWWGFLFLTLFFVAQVYKADNSVVEQSSTRPNLKPVEEVDLLKKVNENMQATEFQSESRKNNVELLNNYSDKTIDSRNMSDLDVLTTPEEERNLKIQPDNRAEKIFAELHGEQAGEETIDEQISKEVALQQWMDSYDEQNKQLLIKAIQRVARQHGVIIKFDKNHKIKSVRKLRRKKIIQF